MTLQQLLYVLTVSDEKSMNKAAEKLFVSQPTLTSAIQSLEKIFKSLIVQVMVLL